MRKVLGGVATLTLASTCWVLFVFVARQQGFHREAFVVLGLVAQAALTLVALSLPARRLRLAGMGGVLATGAAWIFYVGQSVVAVQLSRGAIGPSTPGSAHFEGFALLIGLLLLLQAVLTVFTILHQIMFSRSTGQSLA